MEKFELDESLAEEIRVRVFGEGFMKLVQSVRRGGASFKISLRPVLIGGRKRFQAEMVDEGQTQVKNFDEKDARDALEEIIAQMGARELHLITATGDLHVRVTKKGRVMASRSAPMERKTAIQPHDRVKNTPLNVFDSLALLRALGIADGSGAIRASMRGKYDQINEFLKHVPSGIAEKRRDPEAVFTVVDCGCGKAYLTFALYFHLVNVAGLEKVKIYGVDRREDVIAAARATAQALDCASDVVFEVGDIAGFSPGGAKPKVDMVVSLYACDTATDEALAKAVEWRARYILSAPCCQHELQKDMADIASRPVQAREAFAGLLRQSILRERFCDILTDSFRALIMRILGFKCQVIEFVSSDATARNIMLKCEYGIAPRQGAAIAEYLALRDFFNVTPWLEKRLAALLKL